MNRTILITTCIMGLSTGCLETSEPASLTDDEYAEACTDLAWCLISCEKPDECVACVRHQEEAGFIPVAALDTVECRSRRCDAECNEADAATCERCLEEECATTWDVCNGHGWRDYEAGAHQLLVTCRDTLECINECPIDGYDCKYDCYSSSTPDARREVYLFLGYFWGDCFELCQTDAGDECARCLEDQLSSGLPQCLSPEGTLGLEPSRLSRLH